jgi:hypothetical protein
VQLAQTGPGRTRDEDTEFRLSTSLRVGRYASTLAVAWTVVAAGTLAWAQLDQKDETLG